MVQLRPIKTVRFPTEGPVLALVQRCSQHLHRPLARKSYSLANPGEISGLDLGPQTHETISTTTT